MGRRSIIATGDTWASAWLLIDVVDQTMQPEQVHLWLRDTSRPRIEAHAADVTAQMTHSPDTRSHGS